MHGRSRLTRRLCAAGVVTLIAIGTPAIAGDAFATTTLITTTSTTTKTITTTTRTTTTPTTAPSVESVEPNHGRTSGWVLVLIDGKNLSASGETCLFFNLEKCHVSVHFDEAEPFVLYDSSEFVFVIAPPHGAGTVPVTVTVNGVTSAITPASQFTYEELSPPGRHH
jgi:IPT/TIG domain